MSYPSWQELRSSYWIEGRRMPYLAEDMPTFMGAPHASNPADLEGADVVIIGSPYVTSWTDEWGGVQKSEWIAAPKRVRQQSARYATGYIQEFDLNVFDTLKLVDYGDADIPPEASYSQTVPMIEAAQAAVEVKVNEALQAGAIPVVIGQNSPCSSYAIAKCLAERATGNVGIVSLDTHWDVEQIDRVTMDPRIAGPGTWLRKTFEFHENMSPKNLVEIGPRGMIEDPVDIRDMRARGAQLLSTWDIRRLGIEEICARLGTAYDGTSSVYGHFDLDVIGGAGPAPGDIMGELAEPIGMTDYEVIRVAHELGLRGLGGMSFICIPPGSAVMYRVVVYVIMYMMAGLAIKRQGIASNLTKSSDDGPTSSRSSQPATA
jgi:agmatinase